ncbi:mechanosensitive ion channel family protein [Paractinoplanes maris]|uniref:mechanosensitive ion channel family protein n=1 Tax=Paractinoplanes maris TaxID=1734446 RepID=UPI002021FF51|nr:mechanosensitive ion channel domain-containing protein [Actinoplanes maris]
MGEPWKVLDQHVRPDFRKTVVFSVIALAALIVGTQAGDIDSPELRDRLIAWGCAALVALAGLAATRTASREVHRIAQARGGEVAATPLRLMVQLAGYLLTVVVVCDLLGVGLRNLLVGGAVTGVILGLAAQPVLSNLFAGLVLLFARPYLPGQQVRIFSGAIGGPHYGTIVAAGLLYTVLDTTEGPLNIPNSVLLASAVGPSDGEPEEPTDSPDPVTPDSVTPSPVTPSPVTPGPVTSGPVTPDQEAASAATAAALSEIADEPGRKPSED